MGHATQSERDTSLLVACFRGDLHDAKAALASGANARTRLLYNQATPLHYAAASRAGDIVNVLIDNGADPNATDASGKTPLDVATSIGATDIVKLLESALRMQQGHATPATEPQSVQTHLIVEPQLVQTHLIVERSDEATTNQRHADRVAEERKDKSPPQVGG